LKSKYTISCNMTIIKKVGKIGSEGIVLIIEISKILPKYQVTLPKEVREKLQVELGDRLLFIETADGFLLKKIDDAIVQTLMGETD
jgi:AbrB family looped-hinge helix DNA binding protein